MNSFMSVTLLLQWANELSGTTSQKSRERHIVGRVCGELHVRKSEHRTRKAMLRASETKDTNVGLKSEETSHISDSSRNRKSTYSRVYAPMKISSDRFFVSIESFEEQKHTSLFTIIVYGVEPRLPVLRR